VLNAADFQEIYILIIDFSIRFLSGAICVIVIIPLLLYTKINKRILKNYFQDDLRLTRGISLARTSSVGIISALWFFIICSVIAIILGVFNPDFSLIFSNPKEGNPGWFIFLYALIPALWEEMTFRGVILNSVSDKYSEKTAILVSSVLFGLFHFTSLLYEPLDMVIFYFIMSTLYGIAWGYLVVKSGNVMPSIIAHYLIDAFGLPFIGIASTDQAIVGTFFMSTTLLYPLITILSFHFFFRNRLLD
jgi:membrane protease YdiL (CAAX protease family)